MRALCAVLTLLAVTACASKPVVQLEHPQGDAPTSLEVAPPQCEEFPLPGYPEVEADRRPEKISVQVSFTIDRLGRTVGVSGEVPGKSELAGPYLEAAVAAAEAIRCKPAARVTQVGEDGVTFRPIPYRSSLVYHFFRDERQVQVDRS
jgi:hypothetical protein